MVYSDYGALVYLNGDRPTDDVKAKVEEGGSNEK